MVIRSVVLHSRQAASASAANVAENRRRLVVLVEHSFMLAQDLDGLEALHAKAAAGREFLRVVFASHVSQHDFSLLQLL